MEHRPILITGAHGFVGARALMRYSDSVALSGELLRSADAKRIEEAVCALEPRLIIHTAAISDIGRCEANPEASYQANVLLTQAMASAAKRAQAKLICFSSDQVYTGCDEEGPYSENERLPEPANVYARHKLEAEKCALDILPDAVMLRATWMYDMPVYGQPNRENFLTLVLKAAMTGRRIPCADGQRRGITYVRQVTELLEQAARLPGGVYNYGSENEWAMPETAALLLKELGLGDRAEALVEIRREARHPLWMDCAKLKSHGIHFDTTAEGFRRCVEDYGLRV